MYSCPCLVRPEEHGHESMPMPPGAEEPVFDLTGKITVVTGAGSGIGEAIAHAFAGAGAKVYIAERDEARGLPVAEAIRRAGGAAEFIGTDVSIEDECKRCAAAVFDDNEGRCDVLVNNAGVGSVGTVLTTTAAD